MEGGPPDDRAAGSTCGGVAVQRFKGREDNGGDPTRVASAGSENGTVFVSQGFTLGDTVDIDASVSHHARARQEQYEDPSLSPKSMRGRISKKRPREGPNHYSSPDDRSDGDLVPEGPLRPGSPAELSFSRGVQGSFEEGQASWERKREFITGETTLGPDDGFSGRKQGGVAGARCLDSATLKPLEDPQTVEVVVQDLATREIRRIRHTLDDKDPGGPAFRGAERITDGDKAGATAQREEGEHKRMEADTGDLRAAGWEGPETAEGRLLQMEQATIGGVVKSAAAFPPGQPEEWQKANGKLAGGEGRRWDSGRQQQPESLLGENRLETFNRDRMGEERPRIEDERYNTDDEGGGRKGDGGGGGGVEERKESVSAFDSGDNMDSSKGVHTATDAFTEKNTMARHKGQRTPPSAPHSDAVAAIPNSEGSAQGRENSAGGGVFGTATTPGDDKMTELKAATSASASTEATSTSPTEQNPPGKTGTTPAAALAKSPARTASGGGVDAHGFTANVKQVMAQDRQKDQPEPTEEDEGSVGANGARQGKSVAHAQTAVPRERGCPAHALPVARTFFDFHTVSSFEMRMLPEFFTGRSAWKTPETYMQSRNYMVRSYQRMLDADRDGEGYLTATECRRKLAGDACSILRIHDFLDRFGLVNTRTGGRRPPSYPVPPPAVHLWTPSAFSSKAGWGRGAGPETAVLLQNERVRRGDGVLEGADEREWDRLELMRLMEAAVANPDRWDVVAHQVGSGRSPTVCMRRFLSLAVEETLAEGEDAEEHANAAGAAAGRSKSTTPPSSNTAEAPITSESHSPAAGAPTAGTTASRIPMSAEGSALSATTENLAASSLFGMSSTLSSSHCGSAPGSGIPAFEGDDGAAVTTTNEPDRVADALADPSAGDDTVDSVKQPVSTVASPVFTTTSGGTVDADAGAAVSDAKSEKVGRSGDLVSPVRTAGAQKHVKRRQNSATKRPAYLPPAAPALVLASALVSSVHPEVLKAAMSAAIAAADEIASRSAGVWLSSGGEGWSSPPRSNTANEKHTRSSFRGVPHGTGEAYGLHDSTGKKDDGDEDEDVEMRDYGRPTAVAAAAQERQERDHPPGTPTSTRQLQHANGRRRRGMVYTDARSDKSAPPTAEAGGWLGADDRSELTLERQAARSGAARAAVLSVAGLQARGLAELEDRRTEALVADLLEARVQRLETKLHCLNELDKVLENERLSLEHDRAEMLAEQARSMLSK